MRRFFATLALVLLSSTARAHELRPAYLELREAAPGEFDVTWKRPARGEMQLALEPEFSGRTRNATPITTRQSIGAVVATWRLVALEPLRGQTVRIRGLEATMTDALVRIELADGGTWVKRLKAQAPAAEIPLRPGAFAVAREYVHLGVEHILAGVDHLAFVLGLILLVDGFGRLLKTVTAFTVSHSVTLTLATLGYVHLPSAPVEATIALSIVFVASEVLKRSKDEPTLAMRQPWLVAFLFGLLHGLGFAGGLAEAGLPEAHIPVAVLFFSAGVEIGHFAFVAAALAVMALARAMPFRVPGRARALPAYAIGSVAAFWLIERVTAF